MEDFSTNISNHSNVDTIAISILEHSSVCDDSVVQDLWAGLFASSCKQGGQNDENLVFVNLLNQLTFSEARIIKYACEKSPKFLHKSGLVTGGPVKVSFGKLVEISRTDDLFRLDRELDHLCSISLIGSNSWFGHGGFDASDPDLLADISPTALALNLYVRCEGSNDTLLNFWKNVLVNHPSMNAESQSNQDQT